MKLSEKVLKVMQEEKISPEELKYMIDHAARTQIRGCNRRYFHWVFKIENEAVEDMQLAQLKQEGHGETSMLEEHVDCNGKGCKQCGWTGYSVDRRITDKTVPKYEPLSYI